MKDEVSKILADLKSIGFAASKVESDLNFSNGLLGKTAKGICSLSADKYSKLTFYHSVKMAIDKVDVAIAGIPDLKLASQIPPLPVIDNECRQVKDYCKENGLGVSELIEFHQSAKEKAVTTKKTQKDKKEEERSSSQNMDYQQQRFLNKLK